jgi:hypothetical protein
MTHSPAPWKIDGDFGSHTDQIEIVDATGSRHVATVRGTDTEHPEVLANARLIKAAPQLLAALWALLNEVEADYVPGAEPAIEQARNLIAEIDDAARTPRQQNACDKAMADRIDGYDRDDLGESQDF